MKKLCKASTGWKKIVAGVALIWIAVIPSLFAQQPPGVSTVKDVSVLPVAAERAAQVDESASKISLDFKDAEISTVLRIISLKSGVNIVLGPEVTGIITIRLEEVDWEKALDVILRIYNYVYEKDGNVIRVTTRDKMQLEPVVTKTFILNYSKASEAMASVQDILTERGRVKVSERMNMLIVTDIPTNIFHISQVIERLDKMTPQAYIDSKVIRTQVGVTKDLGINWNLTGGMSGSSRPISFPFTYTKGGEKLPSSVTQFFPPFSAAGGENPANPRDIALPIGAPAESPGYTLGTLDFTGLTSTLRLIEGHSRSKVISNPRIVVLNNQTAKVQVGDQVPIPQFERNETTGTMEVTGFEYRDTGVVLNVTPHINEANEILVELKPEITSLGANQSFGAFEAPIFSTTTASTQVLIKSSQTIAIGGLLTDNDTASVSKVPYLSDIPVLGKLFFKSQTAGAAGNTDAETIFFVTVTSVDSSGQPISDSKGKDDTSSQDDNASTSVKSNASTSVAAPVVSAQKTAA